MARFMKAYPAYTHTAVLAMPYYLFIRLLQAANEPWRDENADRDEAWERAQKVRSIREASGRGFRR